MFNATDEPQVTIYILIFSFLFMSVLLVLVEEFVLDSSSRIKNNPDVYDARTSIRGIFTHNVAGESYVNKAATQEYAPMAVLFNRFSGSGLVSRRRATLPWSMR